MQGLFNLMLYVVLGQLTDIGCNLPNKIGGGASIFIFIVLDVFGQIRYRFT